MLITIGSITTATRLSRIIEKKLSIPSRVIHTPAEIKKGGCTYSVKTSERYVAEIRSLVKEYGIPVRKYYAEKTDGKRRVYNDIS